MANKNNKHDDVYDTIARNIKMYRKRKNMTQAELAEKTEYSHEFIRRIEAPNSKKNFSIDAVNNIAKALDINIELLFEKNEINLDK